MRERHPLLPGRRGGRGRPLRRPRRQVHGRRRAGLLRLAAGRTRTTPSGRSGRASPSPARSRACGRPDGDAARGAGRDRDRPRRRGRPGRRGRGAGAGRRRRDARTSRRACKPWPSPARSSSRRARGGCSARASSCDDLGAARRSPGFARAGPRLACRAARPRVREPLRRAARRATSPRWSAASRSSPPARPLGAGAKAARARWCCSPASRASASHASSARCASGSADRPHRRLGYQCSPYHVQRALHPVIASSSGPPASRSRTAPSASWRSSRPCSAASGGRAAPTTSPLFAALLAIPAGSGYRRSSPTPSGAQGAHRSRRSRAARGACRRGAGAVRVRGPALERPDHARSCSTQLAGGAGLPRAAARHVPAGVRAALDRRWPTTPCSLAAWAGARRRS